MILTANHSTHVVVHNKKYVYFGGSNYLSLAQNQKLIKAAQGAFHKFGFSSGASRLTSGENSALLRLEVELARFSAGVTDPGAIGQKAAPDAATNAPTTAPHPAALVLPAGFLSNQVVVEALDMADRVDAWIISPKAHASAHIALKLSSKPVYVRDWDRAQAAPGRPLGEAFGLADKARVAVFVEPIDPHSGRVTDVGYISDHLNESDLLILDEAHSLGTMGSRGVGAKEHFSLENDSKLIRTGTFSKALGSYGGFVLASPDIIELLKQHSSIYKTSTSLPPPVCAAARAGLCLLRDTPSSTIERLKRNIDYVANKLNSFVCRGASQQITPIFMLPSSVVSGRTRHLLLDRGVYIPDSTSYFPASTTVGLRWTVQAGHSLEQLALLVSAIYDSIGRY